MSKRDQNPSLLLLDEGSTVKLPNLARIPATLRTFLTGTVWGLQDKVQGAITYDENTLKAILTNLSTKMFEDGESYKLQFKIPSFGTIAPEPINNYSKTELKKNFDDLLNECKTIT